MTKDRFDIHQHITNQIVTLIEKGAGEFQLPWHKGSGSILRPTNIASKKPYRGVNIVALWAASEFNGYTSGLWGTYRQWQEAGAQVKKGEKASHIVFYKEIDVASDEEGDAGKRLFARASAVFAAEQVDGFAAPTIEPVSFDPIVQADRFVSSTGAKIEHGGARAYYRLSTDAIQLPPRETFVGTKTSTPAESYYSTLLHELVHWTSHETRCARELGKRFGDQAYAMEELVAELGAAFLCADLSISLDPRPDHAQYLASWLNVLKEDSRAIFTAASKASAASDYLASLQPPS